MARSSQSQHSRNSDSNWSQPTVARQMITLGGLITRQHGPTRTRKQEAGAIFGERLMAPNISPFFINLKDKSRGSSSTPDRASGGESGGPIAGVPAKQGSKARENVEDYTLLCIISLYAYPCARTMLK